MKRIFVCFVILALAAPLLFPNTTHAAGSSDNLICVPILMYHSVKPGGCGKDSITPWELESDLNFLMENGYETVTMRDLIDYAEGNAALPEKPIVLTFDDGLYNNYKYVYPLLKKYSVCAVMSIIAKATDKFTRRPSTNENYSHITWGQINEMKDSGHIEIQNHSYDLHAFGAGRVGCGQKKDEPVSTYENILSEDVIVAQSLIYHMTGCIPNTFAYPYGKYNDNTVAILKSLGFKASLSCQYGVNLITRGGENDLFNLKRICRSHNQSAEFLIKEASRTIK